MARGRADRHQHGPRLRHTAARQPRMGIDDPGRHRRTGTKAQAARPFRRQRSGAFPGGCYLAPQLFRRQIFKQRMQVLQQRCRQISPSGRVIEILETRKAPAADKMSCQRKHQPVRGLHQIIRTLVNLRRFFGDLQYFRQYPL